MKPQIYTEVAMQSNPGPGSWSYVAYDGRTRLFGNYHTFERESSNRAKMSAVIGAARALEIKQEDFSNYTVNTNYKVLADALEHGWIEAWANNGWRNKQNLPIENKDLWEQVWEKSKQGLEVVWVKKNAFRYQLPRKVSRQVTRQSNPSRKGRVKQ